MRYFLDTEFIESGSSHPIVLLSIGIVAEDGREFYAVNNEADTLNASPWVSANVLPYLDIGAGGDALLGRATLQEIRSELTGFIGPKPEFWGYYSDYDWVVFCQIFGSMINLPKGYPMYCRDIKQLCDMCGNPKLPPQESKEHNALNDSHWNFEAWTFLRKFGVL